MGSKAGAIATTVVAVDMGRSGARAAVFTPTATWRVTIEHGAGLGDEGGVAIAAGAVRRAVTDAVADRLVAPWALAVGVPGVLTFPDLAAELADVLTSRWACGAPDEVCVVADVVAWHLGAFRGGPGVVLVVGTGAVALGLSEDGIVHRIDGHGVVLGDAGGGARLGQDGLRAGLRAAEGVGPETVLAAPAATLLAEGRPTTAAQLASFAPMVLAAADDGDAMATGIVERAVSELAATAAAAGTGPVALLGGLGDRLAERLRTAGVVAAENSGDALDGLWEAARHHPGCFESTIVRRASRPNPPFADIAADFDALPTEAVRPGCEDLDALSPGELVARLLAGQAEAPGAVGAASEALTRAVDLLGEVLRSGGRLVYAGAGTSGRLALQDAAELPPTFGLDPLRAFVLIAGGAAAAGSAVEGAEDDENAGYSAVEAADVSASDLVCGVAASGRTPFVAGVLAAARERGAATVAVTNTQGGPVAALADVAIKLVTGPEALAGSTRLAAGTAQKIALNTMTTGAMVRAGAVFGPWMVGMRLTNAKLRRRALRILQDATGAEPEACREALAAAQDEVAVALVALASGLDVPTARNRLASAGNVRGASGPPRTRAVSDFPPPA